MAPYSSIASFLDCIACLRSFSSRSFSCRIFSRRSSFSFRAFSLSSARSLSISACLAASASNLALSLSSSACVWLRHIIYTYHIANKAKSMITTSTTFPNILLRHILCFMSSYALTRSSTVLTWFPTGSGGAFSVSMRLNRKEGLCIFSSWGSFAVVRNCSAGLNGGGSLCRGGTSILIGFSSFVSSVMSLTVPCLCAI